MNVALGWREPSDSSGKEVDMARRVFVIVLDSFGVGHAPDADKFGDEGANTL